MHNLIFSEIAQKLLFKNSKWGIVGTFIELLNIVDGTFILLLNVE